MKAKARSRRASANRKVAGTVVLTALLALSTAVVAKKSDREQPMNYTAKSTEAFNAPNTISTLTTNVHITQGTLLITGDVAKIHMDGDQQISRVVVTGNPAHIQQLDENNNLMTGDATTLDYDNINGIAVLTTNAVVHQKGRGEFHGDKLTYNTDTSLITGESAQNGMVSGTFLPKVKPAAPGTAAKPAATAPAAASSSPAPPQEKH